MLMPTAAAISRFPGNTPVEELGSSARYSPIVLEYHSGTTAAAIYESDLYDYGRLKLQQIGNGCTADQCPVGFQHPGLSAF